jgi:PIN domain nuclease of toxin-antitoxin system
MLSARNTRIWPTSYEHRAAPSGLSLCDRACLALAQSLAVPALTADRSWARLDLGIAIEVIR